MSSTIELPAVEAELEKVPEFPQKNLEVLKEWVDAVPNLPPISDIKLIHFHFSCYYDMDKTKECILKYYDIFRNHPEFFYCRDITSKGSQTAMKLLDYAILPNRTPQGYQIIFQKLSTTDTREFDFCEGIKLLNMMLDGSLYLYGLAPGTVALLDYKNCSIGHMLKSTLPMWKVVIQFLETAIPVRLKGIYFINTSFYVKKIFMLLKPFLSKGIQEMLHFYQECELSSLKELFPPECLPEDYGGTLPSVEDLHSEFGEQMLQLRELFLQEEDEVKNPAQYKNKQKSCVNH
ncbi:alpha-tocopherol transfer protein isoform X2 [Bemisia tabaci]|uniref:alpha-tocopherol transfer protein isoform X2 n=1 Tax=Bemisia tabaci TaxID=7038 RepID=UPI0008F9A23D|nr:PREDICTED: alpha-tocopherol transfer protein-like isoform X2 [Bemisia tabaci]